MNIKEIKNEILNETYTSQSELHDKILSYIDDRVLSFSIKNEGSAELPYISRRYENRLIALLSPTLEQKTGHRIFKCYEHNELEIEHLDDIIETVNGDFICRDAYDTNYFECDCCGEIDHTNHRSRCDSREDEYCENCYDERVRYCDDCDSSYDENDNCECDQDNHSNLDEWDTRNVIHNLGREHSVRFYGVEVEVQVFERHSRNEIVDMFRDCFNKDKQFIVCKRDGSLHTEKGFELSSTANLSLSSTYSGIFSNV